MASNEKTAEYAITADPSGFIAGMDKASSASKDAAKQIEGHFNALGGMFGKLTGSIGTLMGVLAGGAAFNSAIEATKLWSGEVGGLSKQLSISTREASAMNVALRHLGIDQAVVTSAVDKMIKSMVSNANAYDVLGIKTKDANGAWRSAGEILPEVADKLRAITNTTQQNIAGQQLFGKGWSEAKAILKLSSEEMENARAKVKELHLEVDPGKLKKYKEAMNDVKLVTTSLQVQMGSALMPTLTTVGQFMGQEGPAMAAVFGYALKGVALVAGSLWLGLKDMGEGIGALAAQAVALASGDLTLMRQMGKIRDEEAAKNEAQLQKFQNAILNPPEMKSSGSSGTGGPAAIDFDLDDSASDKAAKAASRMAAWEEQLAIDKDGFERSQQLAGTMQEFGRARERDYWKKIIDTTKMSGDEKIQANRKYLAIEHDLRKDSFDSEVAGEKAKLEEFQHNFQERSVIAGRIYTDLAVRYGADSKEARAALGDVNKEQRKLAEQVLATNKVITEANRNKALADVEFAQQDAEMQLNSRQISVARMLDLEQGFEAKRYQIKMQSLLEEEALLAASPDRNPTALAALHAQLEDLERQHQLRVQQIKGRATIEQNKGMRDMYSNMQSGLQSVIAGTLNGTMRLRDIFKNLFSVVAGAVVEMLAKTAAQWAMNFVLEKTLGKASAISQIMANAGVAGAAATASAAAIPVYGWAIAPEAGIAASAAAMSYLPMASARGGYDIPSGVNPITQLHEREMVLPQKQADAVRNMAEGGRSGGDVHLHVSAVDGASVKKLFNDHAPALASALRRQAGKFS